MNRSLTAQLPSDLRWLRVEDASAVAACRGAALALAGRLQFPATRADQLALVVTEAASNLHKHARQGSMLLRIGRADGRPGIELVTIDVGPGFRAASGAAQRDGHSTSGTLGIGLGAIGRLSDFCDLYSMPGHSTVLVARFWPDGPRSSLRGDDPPAPPAWGAPRPPYPPGRDDPRPGAASSSGLVRPITGETDCGDIFGAVETDSGVTGVLCDGLGHGPLAAIAANEAVRVVLESPADEPAVLVERAHRRMNHTRGGAIGVVRVSGQAVLFAGLGNISAVILADGIRKSMISMPGIAGHQARAIRQFEYAAPPGAAVILHSDGISSRWAPEALPGLTAADPLVIAAALLAEAGTRRDDASVLVFKS